MSSPTIRIHPKDNVVIARRQLLGGTLIAEEGVTIAGLVPPGHKIATQPIGVGEPVRRYNQVIGHATQAIAPGQHVHTHNLAFADFARAHEWKAFVRKVFRRVDDLAEQIPRLWPCDPRAITATKGARWVSVSWFHGHPRIRRGLTSHSDK